MYKKIIPCVFCVFILFFVMSNPGIACSISDDDSQEIKYLRQQFESIKHELDQLQKTIDDVLWFQRVGDVAYVDKVRVEVGAMRAIQERDGHLLEQVERAILAQAFRGGL